MYTSNHTLFHLWWSQLSWAVTMIKTKQKQAKVVRYFGFTEKQTIQFNDKRQQLYSHMQLGIKYIKGNMNLHIYRGLVSWYDSDSQLGWKTPIYQHWYSLYYQWTIKPCAITTNSHSRILTADWDNNRINIIDQDGQFLCYIDNCHLHNTWALCVDTKETFLWLRVKPVKWRSQGETRCNNII